MDEIAKCYWYSASYLQRIFNSAYDMSSQEYINDIRLLVNWINSDGQNEFRCYIGKECKVTSENDTISFNILQKKLTYTDFV